MVNVDKAIKLIKEFEGCKLTAYQDVKGVWTIGYGTTMINHSKVTKGMAITQSKADQLITEHLNQIVPKITKLVTVPINNNQLCALIDFCYNLGIGTLQRSTLLKKLNNRDYRGASEQFTRFVYAGGVYYKGLARRREAEKALFNSLN